MIRLLPCLVLPFLFLPVGSSAVTIRVPEDQPSIKLGIQAAVHGDTVLVQCGTYFEHDIPLHSGVCVSSETGDPSCVTVDAQQQGRVFICENSDTLTAIVGLTITGGFVEGEPVEPNGSGGGVFCDYASPLIENCTFQDNEAAWTAGALKLYNECHATLRDCEFNSNRSTFGGAVYSDSGSEPLFQRCAFTANEASYGGALRCYESSTTLVDCEFNSNSAIGGGGAVQCTDGSASDLLRCSFVGNASAAAGAVWCDGPASLTLTECVFEANTSDDASGAIGCYSGGLLHVMSCSFSSNSSTLEGGAIRMDQIHPSSTILASTFENNYSGTYGGAVMCSGQSAPLLEDSTFLQNRAEFGGGGICCQSGASPTIVNCLLEANVAGDASNEQDGGGVASYSGCSPTLDGLLFVGNSAGSSGGGVYFSDCGGTISGCGFSCNRAGFAGGGARFTQGAYTHVEYSTFAADSAGVYASGVWCSAGANPTFNNCTFAFGESAAGTGAAVYVDDEATTALERCILAFGHDGPAVLCGGGGVSPVLSCCDLYGNEGGDWVGCISDQFGVSGNISEDPMFCGEASSESPYGLHEHSPCAQDNNPPCGQIGAWGVECLGSSAVREVTWSSLKARYR